MGAVGVDHHSGLFGHCDDACRVPALVQHELRPARSRIECQDLLGALADRDRRRGAAAGRQEERAARTREVEPGTGTGDLDAGGVVATEEHELRLASIGRQSGGAVSTADVEFAAAALLGDRKDRLAVRTDDLERRLDRFVGLLLKRVDASGERGDGGSGAVLRLSAKMRRQRRTAGRSRAEYQEHTRHRAQSTCNANHDHVSEPRNEMGGDYSRTWWSGSGPHHARHRSVAPTSSSRRVRKPSSTASTTWPRSPKRWASEGIEGQALPAGHISRRSTVHPGLTRTPVPSK